MIQEPYTKNGSTGYFKNGERYGWFITYEPEAKKWVPEVEYFLINIVSSDEYTREFYNKDGELLYTEIDTKFGTEYIKAK